MIRKLTAFFILVSLLLCCCASAEEAIYVPREAASQMFQGAFDEGRIIMADIQLSLQADADALGLSSENAAQFDAVIQALQNATLTLGAGKINKGIRLEFGAQYAADTPITADVALNITYDGLMIETSLLEGDAVSVRWETLLALCDLSSDEIQMVLSLRDLDLSLMIDQAIKTAGPYLQIAGQTLAPYAETISAHIASLPCEIKENLSDNGYYPAATQEFNITVTAADFGRLLIALADQLENDPMLSTLLTSVLAQQSEIPVSSAAELCASVRQAGAALESFTHPVVLSIGLNAADFPLYLSINSSINESTSFAFDAVYRPGSEEAANRILLDICTLDNAGEAPSIITGLTSVFDYAIDPANANVYSTSGQLMLVESGSSLLSMEFAADSEAVITEENLPGYAGKQAFGLSISEEIADDTMTVILSSDSFCASTANGGESMMVTGSLDAYEGNTQLPITFTNEFILAPTADGPVAVYTETSSIQTYGISEFKEIFTLYTKSYDPAASAALNQIQLETVSSEDMQALSDRLMLAVQELAAALHDALPPQVIELIANAV